MLIIFKVVLESRLTLKLVRIMASGGMDKGMGKEFLFMLMVMFTLETGQMGSSRGKVLTYLVKQSKNFMALSSLDI